MRIAWTSLLDYMSKCHQEPKDDAHLIRPKSTMSPEDGWLMKLRKQEGLENIKTSLARSTLEDLTSLLSEMELPNLYRSKPIPPLPKVLIADLLKSGREGTYELKELHGMTVLVSSSTDFTKMERLNE